MENKEKTSFISKPVIEAVKLTPDDLSLTPYRFAVDDGELPSLINGWIWGFMQENSETPVTIHMRTFGPEGKLTMNYGISRMADTPTDPPTGLEHCLEMYPGNYPDANPDFPFPDDKQIQYTKVEGDPEGLTDDPFTYELRGSDPKLLYRFSSKYVRAVEADFMDLTYENLPYAMVLNANGPFGYPYVMQHCKITGTYEGRKVSYLGIWDRMYGKRFEEAITTDLLTSVAFAGVHPDGSCEWGGVARVGKKGFGWFFKDGEEPIVSTDVKCESNWEPLSYANDGTMVLINATFRFADKVIHYETKWGSRGQNYKPLTWSGFSAGAGTWYEESNPCKYDMSFAYTENHNALERNIIEAGVLKE